ncbi:unnamed protein product [Cercopithifilaria johnstoni]|uniref:Uncharacterized protein n=1 Tax=Cercopithifilaria johnstoni TaxID=2874296 RepID=A0A8J2MB13_9BILA|nr:unnamed protein product [Cercopithifilaria johnstoni]
MWSTSMSFHLAITVVISVITIFSSSAVYAIGEGPNGFGCCMTPCAPQIGPCDCHCGLPMAPQFPPMPPHLPSILPTAPAFPQFPAYPSGGGNGGGYAIPVRQQVFENGYMQQPSSYKTSPGISYQQHLTYQNGGSYGYNMKQFEPTGGAFGGYATNPYGAENGNFGDSTYSYPQNMQNENRFGDVSQQASGSGQHTSSGTEYNSSPATTDTKSFLKLHRSQLA